MDTAETITGMADAHATSASATGRGSRLGEYVQETVSSKTLDWDLQSRHSAASRTSSKRRFDHDEEETDIRDADPAKRPKAQLRKRRREQTSGQVPLIALNDQELPISGSSSEGKAAHDDDDDDVSSIAGGADANAEIAIAQDDIARHEEDEELSGTGGLPLSCGDGAGVADLAFWDWTDATDTAWTGAAVLDDEDDLLSIPAAESGTGDLAGILSQFEELDMEAPPWNSENSARRR